MPAACRARTMSRNSRRWAPDSGDTQYPACGAKNPAVLYPQ